VLDEVVAGYFLMLEALMGMPDEPYVWLIVETYRERGSGLHGDIHVRPIPGQVVPPSYRVRFPKAPRRAYKLGQRFRVPAKITDKEGGNKFVHTNHAWDYVVIKDDET
jgi:hypothetical protein